MSNILPGAVCTPLHPPAAHQPPLVRGGPGAKRRGRGCTLVSIESELKGKHMPPQGDTWGIVTLTVCVIPVNPLTLMYSFKDEMAIQLSNC